MRNLDDKITTLDGKEIILPGLNEPLTYRIALIMICELHKPALGEATKAFSIALRLYQKQEADGWKDDEVQFLKKIIEESNLFVSVVIARLINLFKE